jgi:hypothetical protein
MGQLCRSLIAAPFSRTRSSSHVYVKRQIYRLAYMFLLEDICYILLPYIDMNSESIIGVSKTILLFLSIATH